MLLRADSVHGNTGASLLKTAHSKRKGPKSTFILTVNHPIYLSILPNEKNRLFHRPINSAIGTGGLDFLIAVAQLILFHSLFEVVICLVLRDDIPDQLMVAFTVVFLVALHGVTVKHWTSPLSGSASIFIGSVNSLPRSVRITWNSIGKYVFPSFLRRFWKISVYTCRCIPLSQEHQLQITGGRRIVRITCLPLWITTLSTWLTRASGFWAI